MTETTTPDGHYNDYAVVDLGSNSFHLHVIRVQDGDWLNIDRHREVVRMAEGLLPNGRITPEKQEEALHVLRRYGERIAGFPPGNVRVIATSAFRHARKSRTFFRNAEAALGFPIDVIPGEEEARLIYLGIVTDDAPREKKRFIIDIGGGSTEFIYGEGRKPVCIDSVELGNISLTRNVFQDQKLTHDLFKTTVADVVEALRATHVYQYRSSFQTVVGASGSMRLIAGLISDLGLGNNAIEPKPLAKLTKMFIDKDTRQSVINAGIPEERIETFPGALALCTGIIEAFKLKRIGITRAGVRAGILYDMLLLPRGEDRRRITLTRWMERHGVDRVQRDRVFSFAKAHLPDIQPHLPKDCTMPEAVLSWAADLHEIGLTINYSGYHKHGAYLIKNSDLPGFTRMEQGRVSFLVMNHRKRIKLDRLDPDDIVPMPLLFLFRMAWALHRKRADIEDPVRELRVTDGGFVVEFVPDWLHRHPLVSRQLVREQERWLEIGYTVKLES